MVPMDDNNDPYEPAVGPGDPLQRGLLPRRRFRAALYFAAWGVAGLLSTIVPDLAANPDHVMLYFLFLITGVLLILLAVAAQDLPVAERAATRFEGWITTLFSREARA
ncbi:hypothetical protein PR202_gb06303 [Eleusine coracana subsp. coracana]|uniref:Uncharacterized protein n=1 Tax=Eleusine coracana subsp. coracana TaxID=191504 RepID=A0AAV5E8J9_ELECO|nr:hypothetical protein PR202_gb06303 [Eleusine coracana subsp. coracana]